MVFSSHKGDVTSCASRLWRAAWELCVLAFQGLSLTRLWFQMFFLYTRYLGKWSNVTCAYLFKWVGWNHQPVEEMLSFEGFRYMKREPSVISWERLEGKLHLDEAMAFLVVSKSFLQGKDILYTCVFGRWNGGVSCLGASFWEGLFHWKNFGHYISHTIHVWCIHLYLVHFYGKCR